MKIEQFQTGVSVIQQCIFAHSVDACSGEQIKRNVEPRFLSLPTRRVGREERNPGFEVGLKSFLAGNFPRAVLLDIRTV